MTVQEQAAACLVLIEHILREAKLYREMILGLERRGRISVPDLKNQEIFWNQIMMEHDQFIRGFLDPTECELTKAACGFAEDYGRLQEEARQQDMRTNERPDRKNLMENKGIPEVQDGGGGRYNGL